MTVVPTSGEHDHSTKQKLSHQPKLHQFRMLAVVELVVLLLLQKLFT